MRRLAAVLAVVALAATLVPGAAEASREPFRPGLVPTVQPAPASKLVLRIQHALARLGFYTGREDGRLDAATRAAIRVYQQSQGMPPDGRPTTDLADKLDYAVGVRRLLEHLDVARKTGESEARAKLLSNPATRDLVDPRRKVEIADPTRNPTPCFHHPTVRCLVTEARESAKAIYRPDLRDWVLGDILVAEARAGLGSRAMDTASRIKDPRLIIVALRDIAEAKAARGDAGDALEAAAIIPDHEKRAEALLAIAAIQVRRGDLKDAETTFARLADAAKTLHGPVARVAVEAREAVLRFEIGDREFATELLKSAETHAMALDGSERLNALRHVAAAHAEIARDGHALEALKDLGPVGRETPVLMAAVKSLAAAGKLKLARAAIDRIDAPRYRAVAFSRLALAQAAAGNAKAADATIEAASKGLKRINKPFARDFAASRLALARSQVAADAPDAKGRAAGFDRAAGLAQGIADARLRAEMLWRIAEQRRRRGDAAGAQATEARARQATDKIIGDYSRVWMFAELAVDDAAKDPKVARRYFRRALKIARKIDDPWARARSMAKLSTTLLSLVDPGRGQVHDSMPRKP